MTSLTTTMLGSIVDEYESTKESFGRDDLVRLLCDLRELRAGLAGFAKDVERDLLARADEKKWITPGLGEVQVRRSTKRTEWDSESLTRVVVARALDERILDESSGEYESGAEAVARVLSECARPSWRVTPLRAHGIQIDEFCHEEDQGWSVQLPPRTI